MNSRLPVAIMVNETNLPIIVQAFCPDCSTTHETKTSNYFNGSALCCPKTGKTLIRFYSKPNIEGMTF